MKLALLYPKSRYHTKISILFIILSYLSLACVSEPASSDSTAEVPDMMGPDVIVLDMDPYPDMMVPDMMVPDMMVPDMMVPDMMVPDMTVPDMMVPDMMVPDMMVPDMMVPDMMVPDMMTPQGRNFGSVSLSDIFTCELDSDCPSGTGSCLTSVTLNRISHGSSPSIPISELVPNWPSGQGVCSESCTDYRDACEQLSLPGDHRAYECMLITLGDPLYQSADATFPVELDIEEQSLGRIFGAICVPPYRAMRGRSPDFCDFCDADVLCEAGSVCVRDQPFARSNSTIGRCLSPCDVDELGEESCPFGFECSAAHNEPDAPRVCMPLAGTCGSCIDRDGDGRGAGLCEDITNSSAHDCDDKNPNAYFVSETSTHSFPESCSPDLDYNCNGIADHLEIIGSDEYGADHCGDCGSPCSGDVDHARKVCSPTGEGSEGPGAFTCAIECDEGFVDCDGDIRNGCELEVTDSSYRFYPDCDGDGFGEYTDDPMRLCPAQRFICEDRCGNNQSINRYVNNNRCNDGGEGAIHATRCERGHDCSDCGPRAVLDEVTGCSLVNVTVDDDDHEVFDCDDDNKDRAPTGEEVCDGIDNDCDGSIDEEVNLEEADLQAGVCVGLQKLCVEGIVVEPNYTENHSYEADELTCDGIDNDCDGSTDEGSPVGINGEIPGQECDIVGGVGRCAQGVYGCQEGGVTCIPNTPLDTDQPGDGVDENCDGFDGDLSRALFVRVGGSDTSNTDGSMSSPFATLAHALTVVRSRLSTEEPVTQIFLKSTLTDRPVSLNAPLNIKEATTGRRFGIYGGYQIGDDGVWSKSNFKTTIEINVCDPESEINPCEFKLNHIAVNIRMPRINEITLSNLTIEAVKPPDGAGGVIGLSCHCNTRTAPCCQKLILEEISIKASGADGLNYIDPATAGAPGPNGWSPNESVYNLHAIPPRTTNYCETGGTSHGGAGGKFYIPYNFDRCSGNCGGVNFGSNGSSSGSAENGLGGTVSITWRDHDERRKRGFLYVEASRRIPGHGTHPANGGSGGENINSELAPYYSGMSKNGQPGEPGGAGGGSNAEICWWRDSNELAFEANSGASGGAGGCPGAGGVSGGSGGSSIAMKVRSSAFPTLIGTLTLTAAGGGNGGAGQAGGSGGQGGAGGTMTKRYNHYLYREGSEWRPDYLVYAAGSGGGGSGGGGGAGGSGGWSVGLVRTDPDLITPSDVIFNIGERGNGGTGGLGGAGGMHGFFMFLSTPEEGRAEFDGYMFAPSGNPGSTGADGESHEVFTE